MTKNKTTQQWYGLFPEEKLNAVCFPAGKHISSATPIKQEVFKDITNTHINIVYNIVNKYEWTNRIYHYFDLNAGPEPELDVCSALSFLENIKESRKKQRYRYKSQPMEFKAVLIDKDDNRLKDLSNRIDKFLEIKVKDPKEKKVFNDSIDIIRGNNEKILKDYMALSRNMYGILYHDPFGEPSFDILKEFAKHYPRMDIVLNCNCGTIKRTKNSATCKNSKTLKEHIDEMSKDHIVCSNKLRTCWQWLMMIFTNWDKYPRGRYVNVISGTSEWDNIMFKAVHTNEEIRKWNIGQLNLFK